MKKILIVDDSVFIRDVLKDVLESDKYVLLEAEDGAKALDVFKSENPDLVLLDILMPNMNGIEAFREMKKINKDSKILIISAVEKEDIQNQLSEYTVDGYITKPFDINKIRLDINKILEI